MGAEEEEKILAKERELKMQAILVRIMKGRRTEKYNELVNEAAKQIIAFEPNVQSIRRQIEYLIEGDYMIRDEKNPSILIYKP